VCPFYLTVLFIEFSPAALEWLGLKTVEQHRGASLTMLLTIFGVILSTLHQSSLGALFLIAPSKLHPLWYSHLFPHLLFRHQHHRRVVHGDVRGHAGPPLLSRQDGRHPSQ
jgi:Ni/Fe-hydrogenase subunit HybB-like protein